MHFFNNICLSMLFYKVFIILLGFDAIESFKHGFFWHIADLHIDSNYSRTGNPQNLCHSEEGRSFPDNGLYGNHNCDAPQHLIDVTIQAMKRIHPKPDFIIWTGDNLPHVDENPPDWEVIFESIRNTSELLVSAFPGVPILPSIGNVDVYPKNTLPSEDVTGTIYQGFLHKAGWDKLIPEEAWYTFIQGGYFNQLMKPKLRIISLNTILWYSSNNLTKEIVDPGNQFKWIADVLENSSASSEKVYIMGHVAPGFYNRAFPGNKAGSTYHPNHLETFNRILDKYSEVIIGQIYGHLHVDMFTISRYDTGFFKGSSLIASCVTPATNPTLTNSRFNSNIPVNPSIRLVHFSPSDGCLLDYDQFYLNLTKANSMEKSIEKHHSPLYRKLYTFTEFYGVQDLSTSSLVHVYDKLISDPFLFNSFYKFLTAGAQSTICDAHCKENQLCAISCTSSDEYDMCTKNLNP